MNQQPVKRNHHYVAQFHLAGFTKKETKESTFFVFDTMTGDQKELKPKRVAFSKDLYRVELPDTPPDAIEDVFMDLESKTAPVIRTLCETLRMPSGDDYNYLMNYIALLAVRTPSYKQTSSAMMEEIAKITMRMAFSTEERFEIVKKQMAAEGKEVPPLHYETFRNFLDEERYNIAFDNNTHVNNLLESMDAVLHPLGARYWTIVYSPNQLGDFICSDHPVSLHWATGRDRGIFSSPGHGMLDTEVTVPLTSRVLLLGQFEPILPEVITLTSRLMLAILNSWSSEQSRFIYSRKEDFVWYSREEKIANMADFRRLIAENRKRMDR
ncbi:DUF4238 domain-containing protein [Paenibacillus sp. GYB003]|uniref:DUF4238 domain-containing protein n=1 Tax=Paenibacillus sp. GYB003 TaxID=2994392 RepID=UPI002F96DCE6